MSDRGTGAGAGDPPFLRRTAGGVAVRVRLTLRAASDAVEGLLRLPPPEGDVLSVRLRARPVEGEANAALVAFLARVLDHPRSAVRLDKGATARIKTLTLNGDPDALVHALARLGAP